MEYGKEVLIQMLDVKFKEVKESLEQDNFESCCAILGNVFAASLAAYLASFIKPIHWNIALKGILQVVEKDVNECLLGGGENSYSMN